MGTAARLVMGLAATAALSVVQLPFAARAAHACGVAYPPATFVRLSGERTLIVWDAAKKTEHFIRKPTFDGDAKDFGFFVPTPVAPTIAKESDELLDRVADLIPPPPPEAGKGAPGASAGAAGAAPAVQVVQRVQVDDFEVVTLRAEGADALGEWLGQHHFVDRPNLRTWARRYIAKGWLINAMRYAPRPERAGAPRKNVATPTLRFSFSIDAPFYPYTEPAPDVADEASFAARYRTPGQPARLTPRPLDLWFIGSEAVRPKQGGFLAGPSVRATEPVGAEKLARALGETSAWGFNPRAQSGWVVTYLREEVETRVAFDDLTFVGGKPAQGRTKPQNGAVLPQPANAHGAPGARRSPLGRARGLLVLFGIAFAAAAAAVVASLRDRRR